MTPPLGTRGPGNYLYSMKVCCLLALLVLDSVTSTPQWIRQPKPRGCVHDVCVFVCEYVLGRSRVSQPLNLRLCLLQHFGFLTSPRAIKIRSRCHLSSSCLGSWARRAPRTRCEITTAKSAASKSNRWPLPCGGRAAYRICHAAKRGRRVAALHRCCASGAGPAKTCQ